MAARLPLFLFVCLLLVGCEEINLEDYLHNESQTTGSGESYNVTFLLNDYDLSPFDESYYGNAKRAMVSVTELGTRLSLAVYENGTRKTSVHQSYTDADFGKIALYLSEGQYEIALLVYSNESNPTLARLDSICWDKHKVTDTFIYYACIDVDEDATYNISLSRCVAMYRFTIMDTIPDEVTQMEFYYTGGSSTLDITTGFGCKNSRQTEYRTVESHEAGQTFYLYTFPHDETDVLKMTISALDEAENVYKQVVYENIPVEMNMITNHSDDFFSVSAGSDVGGGVQFVVRGDNVWAGELNY